MSHAFGDARRRTTVRTVLEMELLQRAGAFLAAGEEQLDATVRWVHSGEIADIAKFLSGGEVLLTAGQGIGLQEQSQRRYVASVAQVGVACLVVELAGRVFDELPPAVVDEARRQNLPLIGLPREIAFVEASAQVLQLLTDDTMRDLARSAEVSRFMTARLLDGADYVTLVRDLATRLGRALVLESAAHEVLAFYGETDASRRLLTEWSAHSRSLQVHDPGGGPPADCTRLPVVVQGATWGWLHMPAVDGDSPIDQAVLEQGASAIAISQLTERVSGARSAHHQGILINRLLLGDLSGSGFVERALRLGKDLRDAKLIVSVAGSQSTTTTELEREINAALSRSGLSAVSADIGDAVLSVTALRGDRSLGLVVKALNDEDRQLGFSKSVDPDLLHTAVDQARAAFSARQPCQFFDQLGLLRLLVPLARGPELAAYVEDELGALLDYDSARNTSLLPTLIALLECNGNKSEAAKLLFVQRRTLYYRLDKVSKILGLSLEQGEVQLRLRVAVRAHELLRGGAYRGVPAKQAVLAPRPG